MRATVCACVRVSAIGELRLLRFHRRRRCWCGTKKKVLFSKLLFVPVSFGCFRGKKLIFENGFIIMEKKDPACRNPQSLLAVCN